MDSWPQRWRQREQRSLNTFRPNLKPSMQICRNNRVAYPNMSTDFWGMGTLVFYRTVSHLLRTRLNREEQEEPSQESDMSIHANLSKSKPWHNHDSKLLFQVPPLWNRHKTPSNGTEVQNTWKLLLSDWSTWAGVNYLDKQRLSLSIPSTYCHWLEDGSHSQCLQHLLKPEITGMCFSCLLVTTMWSNKFF